MFKSPVTNDQTQQGALTVKSTAISVAFVATILAVTARPTSAQQGPVGTKVAVIDIAVVFENHQRFKDQMEDIKKDIEAFEAYIRAKRKELATEGEKLKDFEPSSPEYKRIEQSLASRSADLQVEMQLKRKGFLEREAQVYHEAYTEVVNHVSRFANQYGFGLVLRFNSKKIDPTKRDSVLQGVNRAVVYQNRLNITQPIIDNLNRSLPPKNISNRGPAIPQRNRR